MRKRKVKPLFSVKRIKRRGKYYMVTRDVKGKIVAFRKWKPPPVRWMWRLTIGINYVIHHEYRCLKLIIYLKHKKDREKLPSYEELVDMLMDKFQEEVGYSIYELVEHGCEITIGEEKLEKVKYADVEFGEVQFKDEFLYKKKRRVKKRKH